jgi:hypothetical protein
MTTYSISAPDGKTYQIEGPAGASQEQVQAEVLRQYPNAGMPSASAGSFGENAGGAAFGRPMNRGQLNVQQEPRPLESALAGALKSGAIEPVLGAAQLATGGNVGGQAAQNYAQQAKPYQEANPISYGAGQIAGAVAPVSGSLKAVGMIPSYAKLAPVLQTMGASALQGALTPNEEGKTGTQYYGEKIKELPVNAALGAIPATVGKGGELLGSLLRKGAGVSTGAGEEAFKQAYKAGTESNPEFLANMRNEVPMEDVLNKAKDALAEMRSQRSKAYREGIETTKNNQVFLDFKPIKEAFTDTLDSLKSKGIGEEASKVGPDTMKKVSEIRGILNEWEKKPTLHTAGGLDDLKQRLDDVYSEGMTDQAKRILTNTRNAVKNTIVSQDENYAKTMGDYEKALGLEREIERSLSLGKGKAQETALKKLQSLTRNNVNTDYGFRQELANKLMNQGGIDLMPAISGQALNSWTPRGLVGQGLDVGAGLGAVMTGGANLPGLAATMATTSPRLMGETAYKAGQLASKMPQLTDEQKRLAQLLLIKQAQEGAK